MNKNKQRFVNATFGAAVFLYFVCLIFPSYGATNSVSVSQDDYLDWEAVTLSNKFLKIIIIPEIGGRIIAFHLADYQFFWINKEHIGQGYTEDELKSGPWKNFGGFKTWLMSDKRYIGGESLFDRGRFEVKNIHRTKDSISCKIIGSVISEDGIQLSKKITVFKDRADILLEQTIKNVGRKEITRSIWDVTQIKGSADESISCDGNMWAFMPLGIGDVFKGGYKNLGKQKEQQKKQKYLNVVPSVMAIRYLNAESKFGTASNKGWIACADAVNGCVYAKKFSVETAGWYPDGGCNGEVYTGSKAAGSYFELEVLSPLITLSPGESYTFTEKWASAYCGPVVCDVKDWGIVGQKLNITNQRNDYNISARYGFFTEGKVILTVFDNKGSEVHKNSWKVSPLQAFVIDETIPISKSVHSVKMEFYSKIPPFEKTLIESIKIGR